MRRRQDSNHNTTRRNSFRGRATENTDYSPYSQQPIHGRASNGNDYHGLSDRDSRRESFYNYYDNYYDDDRHSYDSGPDYEAFSWNEPNRSFDQQYRRDFYEEENDRGLYRRNQNRFSDYDDEVGSYEPDMYPRRSKNYFLSSSRRQGFDESQMRRRRSRGDINDSKFNTNEFDRDAYDYHKEDER